MADVFQEVEEDLRRERYAALWKRYGRVVIAAAVLIVAGTAGHVGWREYSRAQREDESQRFTVATAEGQDDAARQALTDLATDAGAGYRTLARLRRAESLAAAGDHAAAATVYDEVVDDGAADRQLRDLARLLSAQQRMASGDLGEAFSERLAPLLKETNPWRFSARELRGAAALQGGDAATARREFTALSDDLSAPRGVRARAAEILAFLK